jgi:hypothetical protein
VSVDWQTTAYHDKVVISSSGVSLIGLPGPNGEKPVIDGDGAVEYAGDSLWSNQIWGQGVITIAPNGSAAYTAHVDNVTVANLALEHATRDYTFTAPWGEVMNYEWAAAGVAIYRGKSITIESCTIHDTENGIFGKSYGYYGGDLVNVWVAGNEIYNFGYPAADHYHGVYLEGIHTVYLFNWIHDQTLGSSGSAIKDRSDHPVIVYNRIDTGFHALDLVDPEDGAPTLCAQPDFGEVDVCGNIIDNTQATTIIHFGGDTGVSQDYQTRLIFWNNTVVSWNSYPDGGRYYTVLFKLGAGQTAYVDNNIFESLSTDGTWSGDLYLSANDYTQGHMVLGTNWMPANLNASDSIVDGWEQLIQGDDPGFRDVLNGDYRLTDGSPCAGAAGSVDLPPPTFQWDPDLDAWVERDSALNLGACE